MSLLGEIAPAIFGADKPTPKKGAGGASIVEADAKAALPKALFDARNAAFTSDQGSPFSEYTFDISSFSGPGIINVNSPGYGIYYRRENSAPGVEFEITIGGIIRRMRPGVRLRAKFNKLSLRYISGDPSPSSSQTGNPAGAKAHFVVFNHADASFSEPDVLVNHLMPAIPMLGNLATSAPAPVAINQHPFTDPSYSSFTFLVTGFRKILVMLSPTTAGRVLEDFSLLPWFQQTGTTQWCSLRNRKIDVVPTVPAQTTAVPATIVRHGATIDVAGLDGLMFINTVAGPSTTEVLTVDMYVLGIE